MGPLIGAGLTGARTSGVSLFGPGLSRSRSLIFGALLPDCLQVDPFLLCSLIVKRLVQGPFVLTVAFGSLIADCLML